MFSLVDEDLDILVVIGGFNSSNTTHLQEIAITKNISSFHIDTPERISVKENSIFHKPLGSELELKIIFYLMEKLMLALPQVHPLLIRLSQMLLKN